MPTGHYLRTPRIPRVQIVCKACATTFEVSVSEVARRNPKYCSLACSGMALRKPDPRVTVVCATCGVEVKKHPRFVREKNYCSRTCVTISRRVEHRKWDDPQYKREYYRKYTKIWQHKNRDKFLAQNRARHARNPDRRRLYLVNRRAKQKALPANVTLAQWEWVLEYWKGTCAVCGRLPGLFHTIAADHWIPMASDECPGTVIENMVPLCHGLDGCNNEKHRRAPKEWLEWKLGKRAAAKKLKEIQTYLHTACERWQTQ